jgi:hypothetical protein
MSYTSDYGCELNNVLKDCRTLGGPAKRRKVGWGVLMSSTSQWLKKQKIIGYWKN